MEFLHEKRDNSYTLKPMELNYLKCNSIQTVRPIELNFATSDAGYFVMHCADFGESRSNRISAVAEGIILIH